MTADKIIAQARLWMGCNESDGTHKPIIDIYNSYSPLPRGYKMSYTDSWCAGFISALFIKCGDTNLIPIECGCPEMMESAKSRGIWFSRSASALAGDIIFYDFNGNGVPSHVGLVAGVNGDTLTIIEGNHNDKVGTRVITRGDTRILGYICPEYTDEETCSIDLPTLHKGNKGSAAIYTFQRLMASLAYYTGKIDGSYGGQTVKACQTFQRVHKMPESGICDRDVWVELLTNTTV